MSETTLNTPTAKSANSGFERFFNNLEIGDILMWGIMAIFVIVTLFPFWWVIRTALTNPDAVYSNVASMTPVETTTQNFERVLGLIDPTELAETSTNISAGELKFWLYMRNSLIVATLITVGQTIFSAMAAYAFARFEFPFRDQIFIIYLSGLMVPAIVLFIPNFVLIRQLGLIGTFVGIVAPVFFMRQFYLSLNNDLIEAAKLDGATAFGIFWRIALPLIRGPLLTLALLTFIASWNEYLWPLLVGRDEDVRVLTVALSIFRSQTPQGAPDWAGLMAGTVVSMVPTTVLFIFFGRKVVDSIQFSGFK
ncbi:MAG: carbohydrate ABC transporter permease [Chloroflexota bacterium]